MVILVGVPGSDRFIWFALNWPSFGMPAQAWVTLIVGTFATVGVLVTWRQKNRADNRSEWWKRAQWAIEQTFSEETRQAEFGWRMLEKMVESPLATKDDSEIVQMLAEHTVLDDEEWGDPDGDTEEGDQGGADESGGQAQL